MKINSIAIIGCTGLIGSNFYNQVKKEIKKIDLYNSTNIYKFNKNIVYDIVFCAALPAIKWLVNKNPKKDQKNTIRLINNLRKIKTKHFILISTIDVYYKHEYGKNRKILENFVKKYFINYCIIRLPGVFGEGLKKNIIYDLIYKNQIDNICVNDEFQWYDLSYLKKDIFKILKNKFIGIKEFYSPPIKNQKIINFFKNLNIKKKRSNPISYCIKPKEGFYANKKITLLRIKKFIKKKYI